MPAPALLGPDGQPIQREALSREIAYPTELGVRSVVREGVASGLTPEGLAALLRDAANGQARRYLTLAEEMEERYLHYASQLQTRRLAVEAVKPSVEAGEGVPSKIVDAVHELVAAPSFGEMIGTLTDGTAKGYSVSETMWDYERGALRPMVYKWRDQRYFMFDKISLTQLRLATDSNLFEGEELPKGKFICHVPRSKMGIPLRGGLARPAAWAFMLQSFSLKDWAAFSEVYGMPLRIGKYQPNASDADIRTLLRAVRSIASDAAAVIPDGMTLEFAKVEGQHGTAVFGGLLDYVDKQISKLVLGQTMTSDDGSSQAQAKVHNEVRLDILRADGRQIGNTVSRDLIEVFVALNFGPQAAYPRVTFAVAEPEDTTALADAVAKLVPIGLKVGQREMREKLGLSEPKKDEELLVTQKPAAPTPDPKPGAKPQPPAALSAHVAGCRCGACTRAGLSADPGDHLADGLEETDAALAAALEDWQEIADPLLGPLLAATSSAASFDEALAMIRRKGPDGDALLEKLARATAIARGIGDVLD